MRVVVLVVILMAVIVLAWCGYEAPIAIGIIATAGPLVQSICRRQSDQPDAQ